MVAGVRREGMGCEMGKTITVQVTATLTINADAWELNYGGETPEQVAAYMAENIKEATAQTGPWVSGTIDSATFSGTVQGDQPARRYAVQYRDASSSAWEVLPEHQYDRPGDALRFRDSLLDEEEEGLPRGRHRAVDMETGSVLQWESKVGDH